MYSVTLRKCAHANMQTHRCCCTTHWLYTHRSPKVSARWSHIWCVCMQCMHVSSLGQQWFVCAHLGVTTPETSAMYIHSRGHITVCCGVETRLPPCYLHHFFVALSSLVWCGVVWCVWCCVVHGIGFQGPTLDYTESVSKGRPPSCGKCL